MANVNPAPQQVVRAYTNRETVFRLVMAYLVLILLTVILVPVFVNVGQNGYFNICLLGDSFVVFGGVGSFIALVVILAILGGLYAGVYFLSEAGHSHWSAIVAVVAALIAFVIGSLWLHIDLAFFGGAWPVLIYLVVLAGITVALGAILGIFRPRYNN